MKKRTALAKFRNSPWAVDCIDFCWSGRPGSKREKKVKKSGKSKAKQAEVQGGWGVWEVFSLFFGLGQPWTPSSPKDYDYRPMRYKYRQIESVLQRKIRFGSQGAKDPGSTQAARDPDIDDSQEHSWDAGVGTNEFAGGRSICQKRGRPQMA